MLVKVLKISHYKNWDTESIEDFVQDTVWEEMEKAEVDKLRDYFYKINGNYRGFSHQCPAITYCLIEKITKEEIKFTLESIRKELEVQEEKDQKKEQGLTKRRETIKQKKEERERKKFEELKTKFQ